MSRVVVTGVSGRMGTAIARAVLHDSGMTLVGATQRPGGEWIGSDPGPRVGSTATHVRVVGALAEALEGSGVEAVIDFTSPAASVEHARLCAERGVPLVIGSTGFTSVHKADLGRAAHKIPMVLSPNMSVGVNVVWRMAAQLAKALGPGFDVEIVETHHRMKKDAPSGTALRLGEEIARALGRGADAFRLSREGQIGERPPTQIGIQTLRGGDVVGDHTALFLGDGERVELTHRATSRDQFAKGALRAAQWIVGRAPGVYDMQDVLGLRS